MLYGSFVFVQTVRHRDYFLPVERGDEAAHASPPSNRTAGLSAALLLVSLVAVVGLSKALTPMVELAVARLEVPKAVVGIVIAALVLLPEGLAALQAARADRLQTSLNLALGSALASIGLTIPTVAVVSIVLGTPLELGLGEKDTVLLALTLAGRGDHARHRPHHGAAGHRASRHLRGVPVLCGGAVRGDRISTCAAGPAKSPATRSRASASQCAERSVRSRRGERLR